MHYDSEPKTINRLPLLVGAILVLLVAACGPAGGTPTPTLPFVVTPGDEGAPQFLPTLAADSSGANATEDEAYPAPQLPVEDSGYPGPTLTSSADGRRQTALESYPLAEEVALTEFSSDAYLSAIAPSHIMLRNLGNPPVLPGWFYKFRKPDSRREFIVQVVDELVTGATLTESIRDPAKAELAIDIDQVILDSPEVFERFEAFAAESGLPSPQELLYDLELVNLAGERGPIWLVVDTSSFGRLFALDAITGEEVTNPYE